jgi:hypothetical protein
VSRARAYKLFLLNTLYVETRIETETETETE